MIDAKLAAARDDGVRQALARVLIASGRREGYGAAQRGQETTLLEICALYLGFEPSNPGWSGRR